ncbi:hypothetical protein IWX49DRAFT_406679 [Phyllosticta citricarpa]|uniref:Uncharacterized protein n=1 Tax=Phyllosticta citricarpa TaxID=55181 RepID=A0ABR1LP41_9PEZI
MTGNGSDCKNASFGQTDVEVQVQQRVVVVSPNQHHAHVRQARHTHSWWPESDPIQSQTRISAAASAGAPPKKRLARGIHTLRGECGCVHENPLHIRIPYVASRRVSGPRPRQAMCGYLQEAERAVRDLCDVQGELRSTGSPDVWGRQLDALRKSWTVTSLGARSTFEIFACVYPWSTPCCHSCTAGSCPRDCVTPSQPLLVLLRSQNGDVRSARLSYLHEKIPIGVRPSTALRLGRQFDGSSLA